MRRHCLWNIRPSAEGVSLLSRTVLRDYRCTIFEYDGLIVLSIQHIFNSVAVWSEACRKTDVAIYGYCSGIVGITIRPRRKAVTLVRNCNKSGCCSEVVSTGTFYRAMLGGNYGNSSDRLHHIYRSGIAGTRIFVRQSGSRKQYVASLHFIHAECRCILHQEQYRHDAAIAFGNLIASKRVTEKARIRLSNAAACSRKALGAFRPLILVKKFKTVCIITHVKLQSVHNIIVR